MKKTLTLTFDRVKHGTTNLRCSPDESVATPYRNRMEWSYAIPNVSEENTVSNVLDAVRNHSSPAAFCNVDSIEPEELHAEVVALANRGIQK